MKDSPTQTVPIPPTVQSAARPIRKIAASVQSAQRPRREIAAEGPHRGRGILLGVRLPGVSRSRHLLNSSILNERLTH